MVYEHIADLVRAYLETLRGRPCYRTRKHTASEWISDLARHAHAQGSLSAASGEGARALSAGFLPSEYGIGLAACGLSLGAVSGMLGGRRSDGGHSEMEAATTEAHGEARGTAEC